jgi:hypothetical protein
MINVLYSTPLHDISYHFYLLSSPLLSSLPHYTSYRQVSGDASSPLFRILSAFEGTVKSTVTSAEDGSIAIGLPAEEYTERERERERNPLQIMGKLKASAMRYVRTCLCFCVCCLDIYSMS